MLTLLKLKYFVTVVMTGSFTEAGRINHVAQASISQQISEVEAYFGHTLIDRTTIPVKPTAAGQLLFENAQQVLQQYQQLESNMTNYLNHVAPISIEYASIEDVNSLTKIMPVDDRDKITVTKVKLKDIAANLLAQKYDFAVSFDSEFFDEPEIETITLAQGSYMIGVSPKHPLAQLEQVNLQQVYQYPLVMLNSDTIGKSYQVMTQRSNKIGLIPNVQEKVQDIETEVFFIKQEQLIGFFPETDVSAMAANGIKLIPINNSPHQYQIVLAWLKNKLTVSQINFINIIRSMQSS